MKYYEIDAAMLGDRFDVSNDSLRDFAQVLQKHVNTDVVIVPITDSYNGASNEQPELVSEAEWNAALNDYYR